MSEDKEQKVAEQAEELFDSEPAESDATGADDTKEQKTDSEGEQKQDALVLEEEPKEKPSKAEAEKLKQIEAWALKIEKGEKGVYDLPPNLQWMKGELEARLQVAEKSIDMEKVVKRVVQEERAEARFSQLKVELNQAGLTKLERLTVTEKFKSLRGKGMDKLDSLNYAMELAGVNLADRVVDSQSQAMRVPSPGVPATNPMSMDELQKLEDEVGYAELKNRVDSTKIEEYRLWQVAKR